MNRIVKLTLLSLALCLTGKVSAQNAPGVPHISMVTIEFQKDASFPSRHMTVKFWLSDKPETKVKGYDYITGNIMTIPVPKGVTINFAVVEVDEVLGNVISYTANDSKSVSYRCYGERKNIFHGRRAKASCEQINNLGKG
jgi:hypothetical protein